MSDGLKRVRHRQDDAVSRLDLERLRALLAEYYRRQGYRVDALESVAAVDGDGGPADAEIGLRLQREDSRWLLRGLHWNEYQVTHQRVRAWQDALAAQPVDGAMFVTSGEFTPSAIRTASMTKTLRLIDGAELRKMLMPLLQPEEAPSTDYEIVFADAALDDAAPEEAEDPGADRAPVAASAPSPRAGAAAAADAPADIEPPRASAEPAADKAKHVGARLQRLMWERGSRPASNMSIAVAAALLGMIVLTIVFRDRLDPYLGDAIPTKVAGPRDQSPLSGTDYKSDVFDPAIRAQNEPTEQAPKPKRPEPANRPSSSEPSPDEAIKVIERSTPEMFAEEQRRRAAAKEQQQQQQQQQQK